MAPSFITPEVREMRKKVQPLWAKMKHDQEAAEIKHFLDSIPSIVEAVDKAVRDSYLERGAYPREVNLTEPVVTVAVVADLECENALYKALITEGDRRIAFLRLRAPSRLSSMKGREEDWFGSVTITVAFTP